MYSKHGRIVTNCNRYSWATPILKQLYWLPVEFRCIFKTATLVYKFLHIGHPSYLSPHLSIHCGRYGTKFLHIGHPSYLSPHLSIHCGRYGTRYNHPDKRFLEVPRYYPSVHKSDTSVTVLLLMLPHSGMICLMMFVLPQLLPVSGNS